MSILILFVVFIMPFLVGAILYKQSNKMAIIFWSIPLLVIFAVVSWWTYESNDQFVSSTEITTEGLGDVSLMASLDEKFTSEYGSYNESNNVFYKESLMFRAFHVGTNEADDIIYLRTDDSSMDTEKGIKVGDLIQEVIDVYGENYYSRVEQGMNVIGYVDRKSKITIQFWYRDKAINQIRLYYDL